MDIQQTKTKVLKVADLRPNEGQIAGVPANPRQIMEHEFKALCASMREDNLTGVLQMKVYNHGGEWVVLDGNMRLRALQELGLESVQCLIVPDDADVKTLKKIVISSNSNFGEWDFDMLANDDWDEQDLKDWGVNIPVITENEYSRKIESPQYEPTMENEPTIEECVDTAKYKELVEEIEQSNINESEKEFLKLAASRHIVFNYANIAEKYARASAEMQRLIEKSALVIIDIGGAIDGGFVRMTKNLQKLIENGCTE